MAKRRYSVPFNTNTTDVFEVEASSPSEATYLATTARANGASPTHTHVTKFAVGTAKATIVDPDDDPEAA